MVHPVLLKIFSFFNCWPFCFHSRFCVSRKMALTGKNVVSETGVNYRHQNGLIPNLATESDMLKPHANGHTKNGLNGHVKVSQNNHYKISASNHLFILSTVLVTLILDMLQLPKRMLSCEFVLVLKKKQCEPLSVILISD